MHITQVTAVERDGEIILFAVTVEGELYRRNAKAGEKWVRVATPDEALKPE